MKNLSTMLMKGNLTAREKFLMLIQNDVHKIKTGKEVLTPADKDALENWHAKDNVEAREWNRLNEGWKHTGRMGIEVELIYADARVSYLVQTPILMKLLGYPSHQEMVGRIAALQRIKKVTIDEAVAIAGKQRAVKLRNGMDFEYAVYQFAFEHLSADDRKRMNELYPDVEIDHPYLDQEEVIANLYGGAEELSSEAKDKLSILVSEQSYNKFAKEYQLFHYYACIPLLEVARYFLTHKGIEFKSAPKDEDDDDTLEDSENVTKVMEAYAAEHETTIQALLKEGTWKWLDDGLLEAYTPLAVSDDAELFTRWLKAKDEARAILRTHIDAGELTLRQRTGSETIQEKLYSKGLHDAELQTARSFLEDVGLETTVKGELNEKVAFESFDAAVITGESLYALKEEYEFVEDFKKRVDTYDANLGIVYADDDPEQKGEHLDQELLVCTISNTGEQSFLSLYGISMHMLSTLIERTVFFKEVEEDGKTILAFKDESLELAFRGRRSDLIDGYAKLLAFEALFKKMEKEYETDLAFHTTERLQLLRGHIEQLNEAIRVATNTSEKLSKKSKRSIFRRKETLQFKDELIIDVDAIKPDETAVKEHETELRKILGDF